MRWLLRCSIFSAFSLLFCLPHVRAAIPLANFPTISFDEANPFLKGMQTSQQYVQNEMMFAQELRKKQIQNQMMEQQLANEENQEPQIQSKIMIFSQNKYPKYLGCFNCSFYAEDSIHNDGSSFGNRKGVKSIYNPRGIYGSNHSDLSACNFRALHPPVIINNHGVFYGLLTLNTKLRGAITHPDFLKWLKTRVCNKNG